MFNITHFYITTSRLAMGFLALRNLSLIIILLFQA